jgi:hypothetical protein
MSPMTKRRSQPHERQDTSEGVELASHRRRAAAPIAPFAALPADSNGFVQAFADALRDILRDERRRAASAA